jgi:hypothetical protein
MAKNSSRKEEKFFCRMVFRILKGEIAKMTRALTLIWFVLRL